jgi:hypothetical protein
MHWFSNEKVKMDLVYSRLWCVVVFILLGNLDKYWIGIISFDRGIVVILYLSVLSSSVIVGDEGLVVKMQF